MVALIAVTTGNTVPNQARSHTTAGYNGVVAGEWGVVSTLREINKQKFSILERGSGGR